MSSLLREAFGSVRATEQMKQVACGFLQQEIAARRSKRRFALRYAAVCCAMLLAVFCGIGGYRFYSAPISYISVDVNPSVELGLNRLDRVVSAAAYNDDGAAVLQNLWLKNKPYTEAIELIMADEEFGRYLTEDALLSFTVISDREEELLSGIQQCHGYAQANAECHSADAQLVEDARRSGLSFGKYQAFLELSQYDPAVTAQDCQGLSMRQIRERISQYQNGGNAPDGSAQGRGQGNGHGAGGHGGGNGYHGGRGENGV